MNMSRVSYIWRRFYEAMQGPMPTSCFMYNECDTTFAETVNIHCLREKSDTCVIFAIGIKFHHFCLMPAESKMIRPSGPVKETNLEKSTLRQT